MECIREHISAFFRKEVFAPLLHGLGYKIEAKTEMKLLNSIKIIIDNNIYNEIESKIT